MSHQLSPCLGQPYNFHNYLFPELTTTLYFWIDRLYQSITEQQIEHVFFLSREGQPLMRMFNNYCAHVRADVKSYYLEVSRRSTLLPSLSALEAEQFERLFRQYRRISLLEFLSSLGLENYCSALIEALELRAGAEVTREEDFPTSELFRRLKELPLFNEIFEAERLSKRKAFIRYLSDLADGTLPERLVIVDVGWKGTIQDNLFALLCSADDLPVKSVEGYYIGLVAAGDANPRNTKNGLLFSCVCERSPYFHVFNENRALFEVILAADHGSTVSYEIDSTGRGYAVRDSFDEESMLEREVFPIQSELFARFDQLLATEGRTSLRFANVAKAHARMVFHPTIQEMSWFSSVFHVENYGVFERSYFADNKHNSSGFVDRVKFLIQLRHRGLGLLGFWPWLTLHERAGNIVAAIYGWIRQVQH